MNEKEVIQIDFIPSEEDGGRRYAYFRPGMHHGYMRETTGVLVEPRENVIGPFLSEYVNYLIGLCMAEAHECGFTSMVFILRKGTYSRMLAMFGKDTRIHSAKDSVWQFIPEVPVNGFPYRVGPKNPFDNKIIVWPMTSPQLALFC